MPYAPGFCSVQPPAACWQMADEVNGSGRSEREQAAVQPRRLATDLPMAQIKSTFREAANVFAKVVNRHWALRMLASRATNCGSTADLGLIEWGDLFCQLAPGANAVAQ